jgi:SAM-dependent methyltransferase
VEEIVEQIRERVRRRKAAEPKPLPKFTITSRTNAQSNAGPLTDLDVLRREVADANLTHAAVGTINPRQRGIVNSAMQFVKKVMRRLLTWYTRPLHQFHGSVARSLMELSRAVEQLQANEMRIESQLTATTAELRSEFKLREEDIKTETLRAVDTGEGPKAAAGLFFNEPVMIDYDPEHRAYWAATSERIIERPWLFRNLGHEPLGAKVLDLGCTESLIGLELASNGFSVTGIDVRDYALQHPNFKFVKSDLRETHLESGAYDIAIVLSTIEHVGLGFYGDTAGDDADQAVMQEIFRLLKPKGKLFLTTPFGHGAVTPQHRIYDSGSLRRLLAPFRIDKMEFGARSDLKTWISPVPEDKAAAQKHDPEYYFPGAVAMVMCTRP